MADYRAILELVLGGRGYSEIAAVAACSRRDVSRVKASGHRARPYLGCGGE